MTPGEPAEEGNPSTWARMLTAEDLWAAAERASLREIETIEARNEAFFGFLDAVPPEFRDHPEIQAMAGIAAWSVLSPLHPRDAEQLARRYEEIVAGG